MKDIIVFPHMMKTAGSSLIKSLIEYYGSSVLDITYGTRLNNKKYENDDLIRDFKKKRKNINAIVGHGIRPCVDYNLPNHNLRWMTFLRNPSDRYVSNYFYMYHLKNKFQLSHYDSMKAINIEEWEKVDHFSNYQTRFIAGEANAQKAIDILENKFDWVGITEEFEKGIDSFKTVFNLENLYFSTKKRNPGVATIEEKEKTKETYLDFIQEINQEDQVLYNYVKDNIWPKYKNLKPKSIVKEKSNPIIREFNKWSYHIDNQLNFKQTKWNKKSLKIFYQRWYK